MNRQLKYRVWDTVLNKFETEYVVIKPNGEVFVLGMTDNTCIPAHKDRFVVQQFTGVKDKSLKEIYEGDIVKTTDNGISIIFGGAKYTRGVVTWLREGFCICQKYLGGDEMSNYVSCHCCGCDLVVIGNIFETPDLLEL